MLLVAQKYYRTTQSKVFEATQIFVVDCSLHNYCFSSSSYSIDSLHMMPLDIGALLHIHKFLPLPSIWISNQQLIFVSFYSLISFYHNLPYQVFFLFITVDLMIHVQIQSDSVICFCSHPFPLYIAIWNAFILFISRLISIKKCLNYFFKFHLIAKSYDITSKSKGQREEGFGWCLML